MPVASASAATLDALLGVELPGVHLEELGRLGGMVASDVVKCRRGDVVGLALADQAVILQDVPLLRVVALGLGA